MQKSPDKQLPELLAPAGTLEAGIVAFDSGADAVYAGLDRFNARERGRNLTLDEMGKLIGYGRRHGRRVYATVNTLIKEGELQDVASLLGDLWMLRPDAVIVQDLGVLRIVRNYFPEMRIHASTQMGTHNSAGVEMLRRMGVPRVILQRQVTFEEIRDILHTTEAEIEIFVHGALCCGQSGACLFSSWLGGWSGNRGKCKQPCRRRFFTEKGNGFFFSTNDLCLIEHVPELVAMGVHALKIEGRLRGPDYVEHVVSAYRMILDAEPGTEKKTLGQAKNVLSGSLGRKWCSGFRQKEDFAKVVGHESIGGSGLLVGRSMKKTAQGFLLNPAKPVHVGDTLRVQPPSGEEGQSFVVTKLEVHRRSVGTLRPGQTGVVRCEHPVPNGGYVFKTASPAPNVQDRVDTLPVPSAALSLNVSLHDGNLTVKVNECPGAVWSHPLPAQQARRHALESQTLETEFMKSGASDRQVQPYRCVSVEGSTDPELFVPASQLRDARRDFFAWLQAQPELLEDERRHRMSKLRNDLQNAIPGSKAPPKKTVQLGPGMPPPENAGVRARSVYHIQDTDEELVLPPFCPQAKLQALRLSIRRWIDRGGHRVRVTSLFGLDVLPPEDIPDLVVTASFPLPVCNSLAMELLMEFGCDRATAWIELEKNAADAVEKRLGDRFERMVYGRIPILSTRARLPTSGTIRDRRGDAFEIVCETDQTLLLPKQSYRLPEEEQDQNTSQFADMSRAQPGNERETSTFNRDHELV